MSDWFERRVARALNADVSLGRDERARRRRDGARAAGRRRGASRSPARRRMASPRAEAPSSGLSLAAGIGGISTLSIVAPNSRAGASRPLLGRDRRHGRVHAARYAATRAPDVRCARCAACRRGGRLQPVGRRRDAAHARRSDRGAGRSRSRCARASTATRSSSTARAGSRTRTPRDRLRERMAASTRCSI